MLQVPVILNVNENPYPPAPEVIASIRDAVTEAAGTLNRYPDRDFGALRKDLADYLAIESGVRIPVDEVWAANGSNEVMLHLLQAFGGPQRTVLSFLPTYSMYPEYARDTLTAWVTAPRRPDFTLDPDDAARQVRKVRPAVVLLASPNNPTGTALPAEDLVTILEAARGGGPDGTDAIVVVDEAYGEFRREGTPSALERREEHPHLV
nr:aminotransferase class I/II-fold pyridoxal phosphate-dependent enzyme [Actinomycetales bacterium]